MFRSLRSRLLFSYLFVTGLVLVLVATSLVVFLLSSPVADRLALQRLETVAALAADRQGQVLEPLSPDQLRSLLKKMGIENGRVMILSPRGEILQDNHPNLKPPPQNELQKAANVDQPFSGSYGGAVNRRWLFVAAPLEDGRVFILATPRPVGLLGLGDELLVPVLRAGIIGLIISVLLAYLIARWVAAPLQKTAKAAQAVAEGDYDQLLDPIGPNEAKSLAEAFNEMVRKVKASQMTMRDFVANVSHEMKTPLTSIQGFAQAILDGAAASAESQTHAAQVIYSEAGRMERLVDELLDLTRLDAGQVVLERERIDLALLLQSVTDRLRIRASEKNVELLNQVQELPPIMGDGDRLSQVFTNLLDNAIRYTPAGGLVTISGSSEGEWLVIQIQDTGSGIPEEDLPRIFERFYRVDKARAGDASRGAGLGLAISRELIDLHGGKILVESVVGQGSNFIVQLPII